MYKTGIISTFIISVYQYLLCKVKSYHLYGLLQFLLVFNQFPTIVETLISSTSGETDKSKAKKLSMLNVPASIAQVIGPFLAVQAFLLMSPTLEFSQGLCATLNAMTTIPLMMLLTYDFTEKTSFFQTKSSYSSLLKSKNVITFLILIAVSVIVPIQQYYFRPSLDLTPPTITLPEIN